MESKVKTLKLYKVVPDKKRHQANEKTFVMNTERMSKLKTN